MTRNGWIIFGALCVALIGGLAFISQRDKVNVNDVDVTTVQAASSANGNIGDHSEGNMKSKVVLIEYGDFQCPGCGSAYPIVKQVVEKYKDKMGFIFRNFPLTSLHPNALAASAAAEAAGIQGKYWEMHDKLYQNQDSWKDLTGQQRTDYFKQLASSVGVDTDRWLAALDGENVQKKIKFDQAIGQKVGITGTPAFYINGENVGDKYYEGDKVVEKKTDNSRVVWSDATAFENFVIKPALTKNGIAY